MSDSERPNKRAKTEAELAAEVAAQAGANIAARAEPPRSLDIKQKARVSIMDETRYLPPGFDKTGEGYADYVHTAADMSKSIYTRPTEIGNLRPNVNGYKYFTDAGSAKGYGVWVNEETRHAFVVFKGTDGMDEWLFQNTYIASGNVAQNSYFQEAYDFYKLQVQRLGLEGYTVDVTGHSLGGAKAMYVAARAQEDYEQAVAIYGAMGEIPPPPPHSITFNPGVGPGIREKLGLVDNRELMRFPDKEYNLIVRNQDDIVSAFYPRDQANTITFENYDQGNVFGNLSWRKTQHSIDQFTSGNANYTEGTFESALDTVMRRPNGAPAAPITGTKTSGVAGRVPEAAAGAAAPEVELPGNPLVDVADNADDWFLNGPRDAPGPNSIRNSSSSSLAEPEPSGQDLLAGIEEEKEFGPPIRIGDGVKDVEAGDIGAVDVEEEMRNVERFAEQVGPEEGVDGWAALGEDAAVFEEGIAEAGAIAGDEALLAGAAEIAASTIFLPLEILNLQTMQQQGDEIAKYFEDKRKMDNAGQWATIMQLGAWTPSVWDDHLNLWDPLFETDHYKDYVSSGRRDRVLDFYKNPLSWSPFLFDSKEDYYEYLQDVALHGPDWQKNFSIVARQYAKHQANDQVSIDRLTAAKPTMKRNDGFAREIAERGFSQSFVGTDVTVQDMGVLLAHQYAILQNEENKLRPSYIGQDGKRVYGKSASDLKNNLDADAIKSIYAAVARKEYVEKFVPQFNYYGPADQRNIEFIDAGGKEVDWRNLPTYEAAYYGYVNNSEDIGTTRAEYDAYIADKKYIPLKNYLDQYLPADKLNLDRNNLSDGVYAFREGDNRLVPVDKLPPQVLQEMWNHGFHFFEKAQGAKYHWGVRAATEYAQNKYLFDRSKDVNWKKFGLDGNNMAMVNLEGAIQHNNYKAGRPYNKQIFSYWGTEGRNWDEQIVQDEKKGEMSTDLKPANGPHGTTEGPVVPPRNEHDVPHGVPHSGIDGGPKDTYDGDSNWNGPKIDPIYHGHDGESTTSYHSYDTNHHIQEPETASNLSQNAYTKAAKFFKRTFVNNPEMRRMGRNQAMWAELADINGDLVEKAADLLAS